MIRFGPSGNPEAFYEAGYKHSYEMMHYLAEMGLDAYEYSCGRGVRINEETAGKIREESIKYSVQISVHAPYFINLANPDEEKFENNVRYFEETSSAARMLGAQRIVFHPGSQMKEERGTAFARCLSNFRRMLGIMDEMGYSDMIYCPETMGKINQLGDLMEVIELVNTDDRVIPTIDFAHLHAREQGCLNSPEDFREIVKTLINGIGEEKTRKMHIHFSTIEFTGKGEKKHRTFAEKEYGPRFDDLAPILLEYGLQPVIICECAGTMAIDALEMKNIYENTKRGAK